MLIFDVGNVLVKVSEELIADALQRYGVSRSAVSFVHKNENSECFSRGTIDELTYHSVLKNTVLGSLSFSQLKILHQIGIYEADKELISILEFLPREQIAFLTDTNVWQSERVAQLVDLQRFSDHIFRSHEIGYRKLDPGCFPYVAGQLNLSPSSLCMIDDTHAKVEAALAAGWGGVVFTDAISLHAELLRREYL